MRKVIGIAVVMASRISQIVDIEHCALMGLGNQWVMEVQCRTLNGARNIGGSVLWESLPERYPDAKVEVKHNSVTVTLPPIQEYLEVAVFGTPGENDMIRKQIAIFGPKPEKGLNWTINIILYDDTEQAFEQVRQKERGKGNKLLTARAGLFLANIEDNININLSVLQPGWRIEGSKIKVIKSRDAWKMPEDGADFPRCSYEIVHVDESKEFYVCGITVSHGEETTKAEVVAIFKQTLQKRQEESATTRSGHQKQTVEAHTMDKEREKEIQEESLNIDKHKRAVTRYGKCLQGGETRRFGILILIQLKGTELKGAWKALLTFFVVACRRRNDTHFTGTKESFAGRITVLHGEETTKAEVMKIWKQTAGAHISDKERERKIQEESLITSDEHKRAVTRHGKPNTTAIIAVRPWSLLKALVKCFQENAETPLQQEGSPYTSREIKAYQQSEESNEEFDMHTKRERNVTGQDCRAKSRFCTNRKIGSNKITRPSDWYKLNEGIGGVRANYQSRLLHKRFNGGQQTI